MEDPPEGAEDFDFEVEGVELVGAGDGIEAGDDGAFEEGEGEGIEAMSEGVAVGFGEVCGAVEGPAEEFFGEGDDGRWILNHRVGEQGCTLEAIADVENLLLAAKKARAGKSRRADVEEWWMRRETEILRISGELRRGKWAPSGYRFFEIREPKRRMIAAAPFGDRVVHHALCRWLQPILEKRFIAKSFSCQVGKGTTAAREAVRRLVNGHRYVLKCDVRKFFDRIEHESLLGCLGEAIRCEGVMRLVERIVRGYETSAGRGLPIGSLTSQLWGNLMLDGLDHWVVEGLRVGSYVRYTDDFLLFGNAKEVLWEARLGIVERLGRIGLELAEPKSRLMKCAEGVPFCGFRFLPGVRSRVLGATKRRFEGRRGRVLKAGVGLAEWGRSVKAWYHFSGEGNSVGLRRAYAKQGDFGEIDEF